MKNFFDLNSVAIVGASNNHKKLGYQLTRNLIDGGFRGAIFPINLKEKEILGHKTYESVLDVNQKIDLAVIIVPREVVPGVFKQCVHKEIPYCLIITAGFAEKDKAGKKIQQELLDIAKGSKTKIIGPNCLGIVDTKNRINLTFAASEILRGRIGLILQSGAIGAAIFDWAKENNLGISKFVSLGNKVHITEIEALEVLSKDEETKVIAVYLEDISDISKFLETTRKINKKKPIIILKGGMTIRGAKAASSHTSALSTPENLTNALFEQANLIVARDYEDLLNYLEIFNTKLINKNFSDVAIVTNAGGLGILSVDAAAKSGLKSSNLSSAQIDKLERFVPDSASLNNPFDLGGQADSTAYRKILHFLESSKYSAIILIVTPQSMTDLENIARVCVEFKDSHKPLLVSFLGGQKVKKAIEILKANKIPFFDDPSEAIEAMAKLSKFFEKREIPLDYIKIEDTEENLEDDQIISHYQIPFVATFKVSNDGDVMGYIEDIGYPVVYKSSGEKLRGKAGKVGLNIDSHESLIRAIKVIGFPGILQKMIDSPFEIFIGAKRDKSFGISLTFGQGGIFVENINDFCTRILPLTEDDLDEMIKVTKVWQLIKKFDCLDQIKSTILKVAKIISQNDSIEEIEFNPFKVLPNKIIGVDINIKRKND